MNDLTRIRNPRWALERRIQIGVANILVGVGGAGKSTFVRHLIAGWTRGIPGDLQGEPANVLLVGDEDDVDEAWTPAIAAMGGDVSRVYTCATGAPRPSS